MASHLCWQTLTLKLRNAFRLSYGVTDTRQAFWLRLAGGSGWKLLLRNRRKRVEVYSAASRPQPKGPSRLLEKIYAACGEVGEEDSISPGLAPVAGGRRRRALTDPPPGRMLGFKAWAALSSKHVEGR